MIVQVKNFSVNKSNFKTKTMKKLILLLAGIALIISIVTAQDSLYIYQGGIIVTKRATAQIDSIIFYKTGTITIPSNGTITTPPQGTITYGSITDSENNSYKTIRIGKQTWMAENLKVTKYNDGTTILNVTDNTVWNNLTTGAVCTYNNTTNADTIKNYGRLYNWYAVNTGKLCPTGWHIPSLDEWSTLNNFLVHNGYSDTGTVSNSLLGSDIAKSMASTTGWNSSTTTGAIGNNSYRNNNSGFSALPGGYRSYTGVFFDLGNNARWYSSTEYNASLSYNMLLSFSDSKLLNSCNQKLYGLSVRCFKEEVVLPSITTLPITAITQSTAICGGNITNNGGSNITKQGVCWSTAHNPTITDSKTLDSIYTTIFSSNLNVLEEGTIYYVRAYASNSVGTAYGNEQLFITAKALSTINYGIITDIENNSYKTVTIGNQTWMAENLKVTKFNDGSTISDVIGKGIFFNNGLGTVYTINNTTNTDTINTYGRLYDWYAVRTGKLCPKGWHVPSDNEWIILQTYLIENGYNYEGSTTGNNIAKSLASTKGWDLSSYIGTIGNNPSLNNKSGFSALPAGYCNENGLGGGVGQRAFWWSSNSIGGSEAAPWIMDNTGSTLWSKYRMGFYVTNACSVRCLRD